MGRFIFESTRMRVLIAGLLCATVAMALPEGRRPRPEEFWRPAQGRDLSKYKPKQATVPATAENLAWAIKEVKKNGASTKKGTNVDLKATCGIEGPASSVCKVRLGRFALVGLFWLDWFGRFGLEGWIWLVSFGR